MSQAAVVYWSGTGHTEAMAQAVAAAAQADLFTAAEFDADKAARYAAIAFGCPSMGAEQLEESEFEPMFEAVKPTLAGKKIALFGSYGWGGRRGACRLRRAGRSAEISALPLYAPHEKRGCSRQSRFFVMLFCVSLCQSPRLRRPAAPRPKGWALSRRLFSAA